MSDGPSDTISAPLSIGATINKEDATRLTRVYEAVSKNIERENSLIAFRISWAIFLSAGIVTAQGFILGHIDRQSLGSQLWALLAILLLSIMAMYFCFMSMRGVRAAQAQMEDIKLAYEANKEKLTELGFPRPFGEPSNHVVGNYNAIIFPIALLFFWIAFSSVQVYRLSALVNDYEKLTEVMISKKPDTIQQK